ncbi:HlyD family efflux transporter periplasmic adaptor subunit, partial [Sphingomonas baiyangensis]|uniref:HlyD family efflux transporter periplasmic adaptor subunit n=1 Tax=Sphingomonas baiyangensis TaxID=2572576 RepID=UPI001BAF6D26
MARRTKNRSAAIVVGLAAMFVFGFVAWSLWAELDQITRAPGQVIPSGRVQVIQSTDGGQIARIHVREGDRVERGQSLITLETVRVGAGVEEARSRVASLEATIARVEAELFNRPLRFSAVTRSYPEYVANETALLGRRRAALNAQVASLRQTAGLAREELSLNLPLVKTGDVARSEILRMERAVSDIESQITNLQNEYVRDLQAEYTRAKEELASAQQQLTQRGAQLGDTELRAPTAGIVKNVRITTVGGVLRPGDEAMQIVPTDDELIVEAKVPPADIAFIRTGQFASVKFDAYDSAVYGSGEGSVIFVSPDTMTEQREGGDLTFYRVHLRVDTRAMRSPNPGERIDLFFND